MYWKIVIMETSNVWEKSYNKPKSNSGNFSQEKQKTQNSMALSSCMVVYWEEVHVLAG